jgi:hypothetical protein
VREFCVLFWWEGLCSPDLRGLFLVVMKSKNSVIGFVGRAVRCRPLWFVLVVSFI